MARPTKQGVDYFPLDVHLDNKFKFIEIKHGVEGFGIVIKMLQNIYSQGYWASWGEDEQLLFASENKIDFTKLETITEECLKRDIFNRRLYDQYAILTSSGIQKRYKEIVRRRKDVNWTANYLLIDDINAVNDGNNPVNDDNKPTDSQPDAVKSTQSKVKESKVNKSIVKEIGANEEKLAIIRNENYNPAQSLIDNNIINAMGITKTLLDDINDIYDNYGFTEPDAVIEEGIKVAVRGNGKTWRFIYRRLDLWRKLGVRTVEDARAAEEQKASYSSSTKGGTSNGADNKEFASDWEKARLERQNRPANF